MDEVESQEFVQETPAQGLFVAPSIHEKDLLDGESYTHHSQIPDVLLADMSKECCLGIDEAGRGPVLGPMVYGLFYLPLSEHHHSLVKKHHFDDSKVLTPIVRSRLMEELCSSQTDLYRNCGWATRVMSARDISAGMLKPAGTYNLNAQAMDATIQLIKDVFASRINVREIYIDTIGNPQSYQKKLELIFPTTSITVAKKADSLYPCVSAASVCAKVTRDAALEVCYHNLATGRTPSTDGWGSGYPSDARCTAWLRSNLDPLFGWGQECRFSWGTAKDLLEAKGMATKVDFPQLDDGDQGAQLTGFFSPSNNDGEDEQASALGFWFGRPALVEDL